MAKYLVVRPWDLSVKVGDIVELNKLHDSLRAHVKELPDETEKPRQFEVATPSVQNQLSQQQKRRKDK